MNRKTTWIVLAVAVGAAALWVDSVRSEPPKNQVKGFMRLKLDHSQKLLEGIALEDFDAISQHAQQISLLTQDENWRVLQTMEYRRYSDDFRRSANAVTDAARKKNLDGAVLAYMQMTMQCVQCHRHVRGEMEGEK